MEEFKRGVEPKEAMNIGLADKIRKVIVGVIEVNPEFYDNPNGAYEHTCPFCRNRYDSGSTFANMEDIEHEEDCIYLIAKELNGQV